MKQFTELIYEWLEEKNFEISTSTYIKYEKLIKNHICPYFSNTFCEYITEDNLKEFRKELFEGSHTKCLSNSSKRTIMMIVNNSCDFGYQNQILSSHIYVKPGLSKNKPRVEVFNSKEQKKLEQYIDNNKDLYNSAILLALYSGLRIGELCALKWKDINFNYGAISIDKSVQRQVIKSNEDNKKTSLVITNPKSYSSIRVIPIPSFIVQHLKSIYSCELKQCYLFTSSQDKPLDPRTLQYAYKKVLGECNIPYKNFHCLRHTFAARCITTGCDIKTLSEILGHADIKITMEYYFHSSFEFKKKQMNKLKALS